MIRVKDAEGREKIYRSFQAIVDHGVLEYEDAARTKEAIKNWDGWTANGNLLFQTYQVEVVEEKPITELIFDTGRDYGTRNGVKLVQNIHCKIVPDADQEDEFTITVQFSDKARIICGQVTVYNFDGPSILSAYDHGNYNYCPDFSVEILPRL